MHGGGLGGSEGCDECGADVELGYLPHEALNFGAVRVFKNQRGQIFNGRVKIAGVANHDGGAAGEVRRCIGGQRSTRGRWCITGQDGLIQFGSAAGKRKGVRARLCGKVHNFAAEIYGREQAPHIDQCFLEDLKH